MNNYSYITLLTDDSYIYGVILLQESLKEVNSQYPLEVIVTSNVSKPILNILDQLGLNYILIDPIYNQEICEYNKKINPHMAQIWLYCLSKLTIFKMTQFDKLIFLDADIMVLKNLDHLFTYPHLTSALDGEYFNLWPEWDHFNSGILIVEPNILEYEGIMNFISNDALKEEWHEHECIADQEILNHYYKNWVNKPELHLNKYYDIFAPYIQENQIDDIDNNCYFIHFVGRKPWRAFQRSSSDTYSEKYYTQAHQLIQKRVNTLNWNSAKQQIKLAVYGICKNELVNIDKYLKCFSKADYICLLDTGSTDGTWEFIQEAKKTYPNLIAEQQIITPWRFDTARNANLQLIPKDTTMYFMVDLDEIIKEDGWVNAIKNAWNPLFKRGMYTYHRFVDQISDKPIHTFKEFRIHNSAWHYNGIVHEQLVTINNQKTSFPDEFITIPIVVWHYPKEMDKTRYIKLCQQALEMEPDNWIMHLQLAAEYEVNNLVKEAIQEYKNILFESTTLSIPELGRCYASLGRLISLKDKDAGLRIFELGIANCPIYGDNYFFAAEHYYNKHNFQKCFDLCEQALNMVKDNYWCTLINKDGYFPYLLMGLSQFYLKNKILALGYLTLAKEKNNTQEVINAYNQVIHNL